MRSPAILDARGIPARQTFPRRVTARYDAAWSHPDRGWVREQLSDTEYELAPKSYTLDQLARISRNLWKNDPIVRGLIERIITYTVGCGINPIPASGDKAWDAACKENWAQARDNLQYSRRCNWGKTVRQMLRMVLLDGNLFVVLVESPLTGRARIQLKPLQTLHDIEKDRNGRVKWYAFKGKDGKPAYKDPEDVIHLSNDLLSDACMGEPLLAAALRTAQDMGEILAFEKVAVKDASKTKDVIETESGEPPDTEEMVAMYGTSLAGVSDDDQHEAPLRYYRKVVGPETKVLRRGDKYQLIEPKRPGPAWNGFMRFLAEATCIAANFPPSFVLPSGGTGPTVRENMSAVARATEQWQDELKPAIRVIFMRSTETDAEKGVIPPLPEMWSRVRWQVPSNPTIDAGRESQQRREDVKSGLLSRQEYWGETGQDDEEEEDRIIAEAVRRREKLSAAGLTLEEFQSLLTIEAPKPPPAPPQAPQPQEVLGE